MKGQSVADSFIDVMKLMRTTPLTRAEVASEANVTIDTADRWLRKLQAGGMVHQSGKKPSAGGRPSRAFSVTKEWGGQA